MAEARCPASCGEFIQGWIGGGEKLVSCPIEWFSTVEVRDGAKQPAERPRMRQVLEKVVAHFGYPHALADTLCITLDSTIPVGKGMASSTADIAATAVATARHLGETLDEPTLAALCVQIEPTDSTLFRNPTLFDHIHASTMVSCPPAPDVEFILLESDSTLATADFHRYKRQADLISHAEQLEHAWQLLQRSCQQQNARLLGEATTLSAIASQQIVAKPQFVPLLNLVEEFDLYGLNVAHSGSVVGLMLDSRRHDVEQVLWQIGRSALRACYPRQHLVKMVAGGVR